MAHYQFWIAVTFETDKDGTIVDGMIREGRDLGHLVNAGSGVAQKEVNEAENGTMQATLELNIRHELLPSNTHCKLELFCGAITPKALGREDRSISR